MVLLSLTGMFPRPCNLFPPNPFSHLVDHVFGTSFRLHLLFGFIHSRLDALHFVQLRAHDPGLSFVSLRSVEGAEHRCIGLGQDLYHFEHVGHVKIRWVVNRDIGL